MSSLICARLYRVWQMTHGSNDESSSALMWFCLLFVLRLVNKQTNKTTTNPYVTAYLVLAILGFQMPSAKQCQNNVLIVLKCAHSHPVPLQSEGRLHGAVPCFSYLFSSVSVAGAAQPYGTRQHSCVICWLIEAELVKMRDSCNNHNMHCHSWLGTKFVKDRFWSMLKSY